MLAAGSVQCALAACEFRLGLGPGNMIGDIHHARVTFRRVDKIELSEKK